MIRGRLLINWVYYQPVGHTVEALRFAQSWRNANPELFIGLAVNRRAAPELAACTDAVDALYPIDLNEFAADGLPRPSLDAIPADWDYCFTDPRHETPMGSAYDLEWALSDAAYATAAVLADGAIILDRYGGAAQAAARRAGLRAPPAAAAYAAWFGLDYNLAAIERLLQSSDPRILAVADIRMAVYGHSDLWSGYFGIRRQPWPSLTARFRPETDCDG